MTALIQLLSTMHDVHGNTTIDGLDATQKWDGVDYPAEQFRADAMVLDGVELMGDGNVADLLWARPSATVLGIDVPPVIGSSSAVQASAAARVSLRLPPGMTGKAAQDALVEHLRSRVPWDCAARSSAWRSAIRSSARSTGRPSRRCARRWRRRSGGR